MLIISARVITFSYSYISTSATNRGFHLTVLLFVLSMISLILRPNLITLILGWDGLGVTSFFLVIFYKRNKSFNAGLLTGLSNRVGDALILISFVVGFSYSRFSLAVFSSERISPGLGAVLVFILAIFTKRAQVPFRAWLPAAIAAPTPVSALVHSSTLVTAGVYVLIRIIGILETGPVFCSLGVAGGVTMLIARVSAFLERDIKKIVALSTLSQLGVMMLRISLGYKGLAFFHLIAHAFFKALLFIATGSLIHNSNDYQDLRRGGGQLPSLPLTKRAVILRKLRLCGVPFFSRFYSKELILENLRARERRGLIVFTLIWTGVLLTRLYSIRFIYYILTLSRRARIIWKDDLDLKTILAMGALFFPGMCGGKVLILTIGDEVPGPLVSCFRKAGVLRLLVFWPLILFSAFSFKSALSHSKSFLFLWYLSSWRGLVPIQVIAFRRNSILWLASFGFKDLFLGGWFSPVSRAFIKTASNPGPIFRVYFTCSILLIAWRLW